MRRCERIPIAPSAQLIQISADMNLPNTSTPARKTAVAFEDGVRGSTLEHGVLIAPDGVELFRKTGQASHVGFDGGQLSLVADVTFSHNHPGGIGPSLEDVLLAAEYEFRELRVVTVAHRHGVEGLKRHQMAQIENQFKIAEGQASAACRFDVFNCSVRPADFAREVRHRTWVRLYMMLGFYYWREQS